MSAAIEDDGTVAVGDSVFVHPHQSAPAHLQGLQGIVVALEGVEAQLRPSSSDQILRVEVGVLRRDRRRPRIPAHWAMVS